MKHLTNQDLMVLIKLVNQSMETFGSVEDLAQVMRRQDREYKALPAEEVVESEKHSAAVREARRKFPIIRDRLLRELREV